MTLENVGDFDGFMSAQMQGGQASKKLACSDNAEGGRSNDSNMADALKDAVAKGSFDTRAALGNKFRASHRPSTPEGDAYAQCGSREAQRAFRAAWAGEQYKRVVWSRSKSEKYGRLDTDRFVYRTFGRLVLDYGGWEDESARRGATAAALKCMALGEPWVKRHAMTGLLEFVVVQSEWAEKFEQCWEKVTKETASEQIAMEHGTEPAASADAPTQDADSLGKTKSAAKAKAKGKAAAAKPSAVEGDSAKKLVASLQR